MKINLPDSFNENLRRFLQRNGYATHLQSQQDRMSFVKRIIASDYPRFHIYIEKDIKGKSYLTIHLDQKKTSYDGNHAHMGEYDSELVANEAKNIQHSIFNSLELIKQNEEIQQPKKGMLRKFFRI